MLRVDLEENELTITIPLDQIVSSCEYGFDGTTYSAFEVSDRDEFVNSIRTVLLREREDGTTHVHDMLDCAAQIVVDDGWPGIRERDEEP